MASPRDRAGEETPPSGSDATDAYIAATDMRLRMPWIAIALGVVVSVSIRLRSLSTPITSDEGGMLAIARAWAHGGVLYRDVWVDRPQGLLAIFRFWDWVSGGNVASLRIMAMIFGAALVVAVGAATTQLAGRTAGALAAILVGVTASSPAIEGHLANGELLSGAFAVGGFAVACAAVRRGDARWMYVVSGVLGGCALSIKQSGYEGLLATGLWLVVAVFANWRTVRQAGVALASLVGGVMIVLGGLAVHGALTGFSRWWFAFAGYRLGRRSALEGADWDRFFTTARIARPTIWPLLAICLAGLAVWLTTALIDRRNRGRSGTSPPDAVAGAPAGITTLLVLWPVSASIAFITGGQFHRHYWITLCPALGALAAALISRRLRPVVAFAVVLVALVPTVVNTVKILRVSDREFTIAASGDPRPSIDEQLARWFLANRRPGDRLYVMCASAGFYADAGEDPVYPYLWQDNVQMVPGALDKLRALLSSPTHAPRFIAIYESMHTCDPSGQTATIVQAGYRPYTIVSGVSVLQRVGA